ncbi:MAG: hypothetical protein JXK16_10080 [Thiotrichales bacterium]|nr:hypothetical protein [Thiotrichales bacterium]
MKPKIPNIVDVEASGFGSDSYPIEVGVVLSNGERYCALIRPEADWVYWDESAEKTHKITRKCLLEHGKSVATVAKELNAFLQNMTVYSDGWVVDSPWLKQLFYRAKFSPTFSISPLEMILTEPQMNVWHSVKDNLMQGKETHRHRASYDAQLIQDTYVKTAQAV